MINIDNNDSKKELATLAGGCFWCLEAIFEELKGVHKVISGYSGGHLSNPSYENVSSGATGHAEVVQVTFDPQAITYIDILRVFFSMHDPTTLNRQGNDIGSQYRSAIFYHNNDQKSAAELIIAELEQEKLFSRPIVTEIKEFTSFYPAEAYHQHYYQENKTQPYCRAVIEPKLAKFRKQFVDHLKK